MSDFWEKTFFVLTWIIHGVGYLSPNAYGVMHKLHHAYADKENDPHTPTRSHSAYAMYKDTKKSYLNVLKKKIPIEPHFYNNVPVWDAFDKFACSKYSRLFWLVVYVAIYWFFAPSIFFWLILPFQLLLNPLQGLCINWIAHQPKYNFNYTNFQQNNLSQNILKFDFLFLGEGYHNNHHANPRSLNLRTRWYEFDIGYWIIRFMSFIGIIKLKSTYSDPRLAKLSEV
jgi:stearoyl-CoA desaturase (delta-9 desaturase)